MITEMQAADAVTYLVAIGATTAKDGQGQAWADWVNHEVPEAQPAELLEATRLAIRIWKRQGKAYQVDATHFSDALKQLRAERISKAEQESPVLPEGLEDEPIVERRWINVAKENIRAGMPRGQAEALAWQSIGRTPPPKLEAHSRSVRPLLRLA
ncbi:hypothetical protein [Schaalia turicensis]|uniref:hypothetical protein n=1 Tax=Schaalia turicensis TaxID=131111 RepID=UPI00061D56F6|nr:hypothetical protein [Schaalia turicensis]